MTPTVLAAVVLPLVAGALLLTLRHVTKLAHAGRSSDLGVVSTRWLSELRRDEPWSRS